MKAFGIVLGVIVVLLILMFGGLGLRYIMAPIIGTVEKQEITTTGAYRIQGYERFYDIQAQVDAVDVKLASLPSSGLDIREKTECRGLVAQKMNLIAEYNSRSSAVETQGRWRASNLPSRLVPGKPRECN